LAVERSAPLEIALFSLALATSACGAARAKTGEESAPKDSGALHEASRRRVATSTGVSTRPEADATSSDPSPDPPPDPPQRVAPSERADQLGLLPVEGFEAAALAAPREGLREPRPVVVVAHGAGGTPEWHCASWQALLRSTAFIVCPRGRSMARRGEYAAYYFPDHLWLEREVMAVVAAVERELGARADTRRMLYAGYSQGATMGALMIVAHAARFPRLALLEGGFSEWNVAIGKRFRQNGGERVLFACGTAHCATRARRSAEWLEQTGVAARVEHAEGAGHTSGGDVAKRVAASVDFLSGGDRGFDFTAP